jgi:ATP-dependent helicase/nuclease subunit A
VLSDDVKKTQAVEGRVVGTAAHLIISSIDLNKEVNAGEVRAVADELMAEGLISAEAMECVDIESIAGFFESELGRMAVDANNKVRREWPFTFALPACQLAEDSAADDTIVVQGIVDMLIETADGLVVIDFKTDHVSGGQIAERAKLYAKQVELYATAAETILKKPVLSKWLYFLSAERAFEVKS